MTPRTIKDFEALTGADALTPAERALIDACRAGEACVRGDTVPAKATSDNTIRAELLKLLITGGTPDSALHETGIWLEGGWINGQLDLSFTRACGRTFLHKCHFAEKPRMEQAHLQLLGLEGSHLPGLWAQGARVTGSMFLRSVRALGTVDVNGAEIGGQLDCSGASFDGRDGRSLNAQGMKVGESLFLSSVMASGTVDVNGADIGGQMACDGASFDGKDDVALNAQGVKVGASLFLTSVTASGTVDVNGADIGGPLTCVGASFDGKKGMALNAQGVKLGADLFLSSVKALGTVAVNGADVGGQLDCEGATFDGKEGIALNAERLRVAQGFFWRGLQSVTGNVALGGAHVSDLADDMASWPGGPDQLNLDGFTYDRIAVGPTSAAARLPWLRAGSNLYGTFYPQPYTQLAKVLWDMGHARDARRVLLERETRLAEEQWKADRAAYLAARNGGVMTQGDMGGIFLRMWLARTWSSAIRRVAGHGYAPQRALYWSAGLIGLSALCYFLGWQLGAMVPNSDVILTSADWAAAMVVAPEAPTQAWLDLGKGAHWTAQGSPHHYETFYALAYATDVFVPLVDLGQESTWVATTVTWPGFVLRWGTFGLEIVGWIVTALGAAAITGIIQRGRD